MGRMRWPAAVLLLLTGPALHAQRYLPDDPLRTDRDDLPIPRPAEVELSTAYDVIEQTFRHRPHGPIPPAANVNTLGEVPDSSWFTNRAGARALSVEEIVRGPDRGSGPDTSRPWTVLAGKSQGITPGFTIRDARGAVYFVKFDRREYPHLSTAAEVISTALFHALGYFVPENHLTHFRREQLVIGEGAMVAVKGGPKRPMTPADLDVLLRNVAPEPDGTLRAVASLRLAGVPLGPHRYLGTRPDDPNDVFPHEQRRELRGLRVFAAWLNHDDSRGANTLDTYLGEEGRGHLRHHLIDFSSTLGAGSDAQRRIAPQNPRAGNEYILDWGRCCAPRSPSGSGTGPGGASPTRTTPRSATSRPPSSIPSAGSRSTPTPPSSACSRRTPSGRPSGWPASRTRRCAPRWRWAASATSARSATWRIRSSPGATRWWPPTSAS
jgi:hypothetical protein